MRQTRGTALITAGAAIVAAAVLAAAQGVAPTPPPPAAAGAVTGTCNYSPVVADLDKAVDFYGRAIGLRFDPNAPTRKFDATTPLLDIHGVHGARMRWAAAPLPGGRCGLELVEFGNIDRKAVQPRPQDPGATTLILLVRDIAPALARAKQAGAAIVSAGGAAIPLPNGRGAAVLLKDPDGHYVEFLQLPPPATDTGTAPASAGPAGGAPAGPAGASAGSGAADPGYIGWRVRLVVERSDDAVKLYRELGFQVPAIEFAPNKVFADLNGISNVPVKINNADLPGATRLELVAFQGLPHTAVHPRVQDPGATRFQLRVNDMPRVAQAVTAAGGDVVSTGGRPWPLPAGRGGTIDAEVVRDPNGLYLVLVGTAR